MSLHRFAFWFLFLFHLGILYIFYQNRIFVSRDSVLYLEMAQAFLPAGGLAKIPTFGHHPFYALMIAQFSTLFESKDVFTLLFSAQAVTALGGLLGGVAVYFLTKNIYSSLVALIAYFLYILQPYYCRQLGDALSDLPYLAFFLWSVYFLHRGILEKAPFFFLSAGFLGGCAYLTRPEGLVLFVTVLALFLLLVGTLLQKRFPLSLQSLILSPLFLVGSIWLMRTYSFPYRIFLIPLFFLIFAFWFGWFASFFVKNLVPWKEPWSRKKIILSALLFFLSFFSLAFPYMYSIGGISLKQRNIGERLSSFLTKADPGKSVRGIAPSKESHQQDKKILAVKVSKFDFVPTRTSSDFIPLTLLKTAHPIVGILFFIVLFARVVAIFSQKKFAYSSEFVLYLILLFNFIVLFAVNHSSGYISRRHTFPFIGICLPFAAYGLFFMVGCLHQKFLVWLSSSPILHWVIKADWRVRCYQKIIKKMHLCSFGQWLRGVLFLFALILFIKAYPSTNQEHIYFEKLSQYLYQNYGPNTVQMGNLSRVALYSLGKNVPFTKPVNENGLVELSEKKVDLIVIEANFLRKGPYKFIIQERRRLLQFWLKKKWIQEIKLPQAIIDPENKTLIYQVTLPKK